MLVFGRELNQSIELWLEDGRKIVITVVDFRPGKVRLGIEADTTIQCHRTEIANRIRREGRAAAQVKAV